MDEYGVPPHERSGGIRRLSAVTVPTSTTTPITFGAIADAEDEGGGMLRAIDRERIAELVKVFEKTGPRNRRLMKYYEANVTLPEVNLGFALDERLARGLDVRCGWPQKAVSCLVTRSIFDGYVSTDEYVRADLARIVQENQLVAAYNRARFSEATLGVTFATLSWDDNLRARIRFHTAMTAAGVWDGQKGRIGYGMAIIDSAKFEGDTAYRPSVVNVYTDEAIIVLTRIDSEHWRGRYVWHAVGRPLIEPLIHNPTDKKPFGQSRITHTVMSVTDEAIRTLGRLSMSAELYSYPQKYILGLSDQLINDLDSFVTSMARIVKLGPNPETGQNPDIRQMNVASMEPHLAVLRHLATLFAGETACPVSELGVIQDNPSSAEAILASKESLITLVESFNAANGSALYAIARMALAINEGVSIEDLDPAYAGFEAHFKSPTLASMVAQADVVTKIASVDPEFAGTDTFYALMGIDSATIQQIQAEKTANRGKALLNEILGGGNGNAEA